MTQTILSENNILVRKRGFYIYKDGVWKPCKAIVYMNGAHTKTKGRLYDNGWKA